MVVTAACGPALAQTATASTDVSEVIVTGTRLPAAAVVAGGPAISIDAADLERANVLSLETYLNTLPQVVPSFSAAANNPSANGAALVDLRGLGPSRNLVLLDGRRMVGARSDGAVDVNAIPPGVVERIEVTTGGASAVYGADAVAGVVNIILKHRQDGVTLSGRSTLSDRGDARQEQIDLTLGRSWERGRLLASATWYDRDAVGKGERSFSSQAQSPSGYLPAGTVQPAGPNLPSQATINAVFAGYGVAPGAVPRNSAFSFNDDGTLFAPGSFSNPVNAQNYRGTLDDVVAAFYPDVYAYNFEPFNKLILPLTRKTAALIGDVEVSDRITLYGQGLYARYDAGASLAPTPAPTEINPLFPAIPQPLFVIPATHPLIPADLARILASRTGDTPPVPGAGAGEAMLYRLRTVAFGARTTSNRIESGHAVVGARFKLPAEWDGDAYGAWGRYRLDETLGGLLSVTRLQQLLLSPTAGADLCEGGFNPFGVKAGQACIDYIRAEATNRTRIDQENYVVSASGPVFRAPAGQVFLALGAELREVHFKLTPQAGIAPGTVAGFTAVLPLSGTLRYRDVFAEASIPLWSEDGKPLVDAVVGARLSDDTHGHLAKSYKAELSWRPFDSLRLRGAFQRAVRAPNVDELFAPQGTDSALASDPCSLDSPQRTPQVLALCEAQARAIGFPVELLALYVQGFPEVDAVKGGNPDLESERATTFTVGFVWQPELQHRWIQRPMLTVDGYDIDLKGAIGEADAQVQVNACYNLDGGNPSYSPTDAACATVQRSVLNFGMFGLDARDINQARIATSGVDATASLSFDLAELAGRPAFGTLETRLLVSWLGRFDEQPTSLLPKVDIADTVAGSATLYRSLPRWKGRADLIWTSGDFEVALAGRFVDAMSHRALLFDDTADVTGVGSAAYFDLSGRWTIRREAELRVGVVNLFDRGPEIYRGAVDANTEPSTYDVIGRRFWIGLTLRR